MTEQTSRIRVAGAAPYDVLVGRGLLGELPGLLGSATRVAIIHPPTLLTTAEATREDLTSAGFEAHVIEVPDGEGAKTQEAQAAELHREEHGSSLSDAPRGLRYRRL